MLEDLERVLGDKAALFAQHERARDGRLASSDDEISALDVAVARDVPFESSPPVGFATRT
jgi:hypothetical protein